MLDFIMRSLDDLQCRLRRLETLPAGSVMGSVAAGQVAYGVGGSAIGGSAGLTTDGKQIALPTSGSTGGVLLGGDAQIYRGAANELHTHGDNIQMSADGLIWHRVQRSSANTSGPIYEGRKSRGTTASPAAVQSGDALFRLQAGGYMATGWSTQANGDTLVALATEAWTDSASGRQTEIWVIANGTITPARAMIVAQDGSLLLGVTTSGSGAAKPQLVIAQSAGSAGTVSNAAGLFTRNSTTAELWAFDEAGNETQLSPHHDVDIAIAAGLDVPDDDYYPAVRAEHNYYLGATAYTYHHPNGQTRRVVKEWPAEQRRDWDVDQAYHASVRAAEQAAWDAQDEHISERPADYVYKPMPAWMARRLAAKKAAGK